jgi:hypothetical protein
MSVTEDPRGTTTTKENLQDNEEYHHMIEELEKLTVQKFNIALDYWMNELNFNEEFIEQLTGTPPGAAYDEGLYPSPENKPMGKKMAHAGRKVQLVNDRNKALAFACKALLEYQRQQRLPQALEVAASRRATIQAANNKAFQKAYNKVRTLDPLGEDKFTNKTSHKRSAERGRQTHTRNCGTDSVRS